MEYHIGAGPYERGQRAETTELRIGVARQTHNFVSRAAQGTAQNGSEPSTGSCNADFHKNPDRGFQVRSKTARIDCPLSSFRPPNCRAFRAKEASGSLAQSARGSRGWVYFFR